MLDKEYNFYLDNKESLKLEYPNKFIVVVGQEVKNSFDTEEEALAFASKKFGMGKFLIQKVALKEEEVFASFSSQVLVGER